MSCSSNLRVRMNGSARKSLPINDMQRGARPCGDGGRYGFSNFSSHIKLEFLSVGLRLNSPRPRDWSTIKQSTVAGCGAILCSQVYQHPGNTGVKYSRSGIEPATNLCRSTSCSAPARLPLRCEDDLNDDWFGRNAIAGYDDFDYDHEHR